MRKKVFRQAFQEVVLAAVEFDVRRCRLGICADHRRHPRPLRKCLEWPRGLPECHCKAPRRRIAVHFAAHRVSLVRHRRGANLRLFKGLLHLLEMLEEAYVVGELGGCLRDSGEDIQDSRVDLPRICLPRHRIASREPHLFRNHRVEPAALFVIPVEELEPSSATLQVLRRSMQGCRPWPLHTSSRHSPPRSASAPPFGFRM